MLKRSRTQVVAVFFFVLLCSRLFVQSGHAGESFNGPFSVPSLNDVGQISSAAEQTDRLVTYTASSQSHPKSDPLSYDFFDVMSSESSSPSGRDIEEPSESETSEYGASVIMNSLVRNHISFFQTNIKMREKFAQWLDRSGKYIEKMNHDLELIFEFQINLCQV